MPDISPSSLPQPFIAPGLVTQYYRGDKTWQFLNKAAVGLGDVDNTGDLDKPVSTAAKTLAYGAQGRTRSPGCMVRKIDAPTIATATYTLIDWSGHWSASNQDGTVWAVGQPSRFYAPVTGRYTVAVMVCFASNATGVRIAQLRQNSAGSATGGSSVLFCTTGAPNGTVGTVPMVLTDVHLDAGSYLEAFAYQNSGAALAVGASGGVTSTFSMSYIGHL